MSDLQGGHFVPGEFVPPGSILLGPAYPIQASSQELEKKVEELEEKMAEQQKRIDLLYKLVRDLHDALPTFSGGLNTKVNA